MALYYVLQALELPRGSEIIVPALTFWVMPEVARVAGLKVVFADVDPATFVVDAMAIERAMTPATRAVMVTHLYGLPCDVESIRALAASRGLRLIEDCAHALGATYDGRAVGTFGDAGIFSFEALKPLNCYGGGMATVRDDAVAARVRALVERDPWPSAGRVTSRLLRGRIQRTFLAPRVFTATIFPILWTAALVGADFDPYPWEKVRPLDRLPASYGERFSNVQAAIGLAALDRLDDWTERTRRHALILDEALGNVSGVTIPAVPPPRSHAYYQYCIHAPQPDRCARRCVLHGVDVETLHVEVCSDLELFGDARIEAPGARRAARAIQIPVYSSLTDDEAVRVAKVVRAALSRGAAEDARSARLQGDRQCSRPRHT